MESGETKKSTRAFVPLFYERCTTASVYHIGFVYKPCLIKNKASIFSFEETLSQIRISAICIALFFCLPLSPLMPFVFLYGFRFVDAIMANLGHPERVLESNKLSRFCTHKRGCDMLGKYPNSRMKKWFMDWEDIYC